MCLQHISYPKLGVILNFCFMFIFFLFVFGAVREQIICYACTYTHLFLTYIPGKTKSAHHSVFAAFHTHLQASVTHWDMSWESNTSLCDEAGPGINVKPKKKKGLIVRNVLFIFFPSTSYLYYQCVTGHIYRCPVTQRDESQGCGLQLKHYPVHSPQQWLLFSRSQTYWFEGHECVPQTTIKII